MPSRASEYGGSTSSTVAWWHIKHDTPEPPHAVLAHLPSPRSLTGGFGKTEIDVPRARLQTSDGRAIE